MVGTIRQFVEQVGGDLPPPIHGRRAWRRHGVGRDPPVRQSNSEPGTSTHAGCSPHRAPLTSGVWVQAAAVWAVTRYTRRRGRASIWAIEASSHSAVSSPALLSRPNALY